MQSTNSEYGSPYSHVTFTFTFEFHGRKNLTQGLEQQWVCINQIILPKYIINLYYQTPYCMSSKIVCLFRKNIFTIKKSIVPDTKKGTDRFSYSVASKFCECLLQERLSPSLYNRDQANHSAHTFRADFVWADSPEEWGSWWLCCCWCCSALFSWLQVVGSDLTLCTLIQWPLRLIVLLQFSLFQETFDSV